MLDDANTGLRPPESQPQASTQPKQLMWDDEGPFFTKIINTWKMTMFSPIKFFSAVKLTGMGKPLIYALIFGVTGSILNAVWQLLMTKLNIPMFGNQLKFLELFNISPEIYSAAMIVLSPILIIMSLFIWGGILHLSLMILGGTKNGFEATFRSLCYSYSPFILCLLPICGVIVAGIWMIVLVIIGLRETHQSPTWKAVVGYFMPIVLCICLAIGAAIAIPLLIAPKMFS
ncbi:MAG: YIP1 family protein [Candidatus Brocadiia bacterium]